MSFDFPEVYQANSPPEWATLVPLRKPPFKVHTSLGLAHSAIADKKPRNEVALYHLEVERGEAVWKKVWEYLIPTQCGECGRSSVGYEIPYNWEGRIKDAPVVCWKCRDEQRSEHLKGVAEREERRAWERLNKKYGE